MRTSPLRLYVFCAAFAYSGFAFAQDSIDEPEVTQESCVEFLNDPGACPEGLTPTQCEIRDTQALLKTQIENCKIYPDVVEQFSNYYPIEDDGGFDLGSLWTNFFSWLSLLVVGLIAEFFRRRASSYKSDIVSILNWFADPLAKKNTEGFEQTGVNLIIVGEGGVGKTSIVKALTASPHASPDIPTVGHKSYSIFHQVKTTNVTGREIRKLVRIYIEDYEGQRFMNAVDNEPLKSRQEFLHSDVLLLLVDLFPKKGIGDDFGPFETPDADRVEQHIRFFDNDGVHQALIKLLGRGHKNVILFINKIDMVDPKSAEFEKAIIESFQLLINRWNAVRGVTFRVILGSVANGRGLVGHDEFNPNNKSVLDILLSTAGEFDLKELELNYGNQRFTG